MKLLWTHAQGISNALPLTLLLITLAFLTAGVTRTTAQDSRLNKLPALLRQLDDDDSDKRMKAAQEIAKLGPQAMSAAPALIELLDDKSLNSDGERVASYYSQALAALGPLVVPKLIDQLSTNDSFRLAGVCEALHQLGTDASPAVKVLVPKLDEADNNELWAYSYVFEGVGPQAAPAVPNLIKQLESTDFQLQVITCRALAAIGPAAKAACPGLLVQLDEGNLSVKGHAALALGSIGVQPGLEIPEKLATALEHPHYVVRERTLEGIGRLGKNAKSILPVLEKYMEDKKFNAPVDVALAYFRIGGEAETSLKRLSEIASHYQNELEAIVAIGKMGPAAAPVIPMLLEKLDSEDPDVAYEACFALAAIGDPQPKILEKLEQTSKSDDDFLATGARQAAAKLRGSK